MIHLDYPLGTVTEFFRFWKAILVALILGAAVVTAADKLADIQARGNREAISFQKEMMAEQFPQFFSVPDDETDE